MSSWKFAFSQKIDTRARICGKIIASEIKNQNVKMISNVVQGDAKWREDSNSGLKIEIE